MTQTIDGFVDYLESVHSRTVRLLPLIPKDKLKWRPANGKFSFGDLVRHLAAIERYLFVETVTGGANRYPGHGEALAKGFDAVISYYETLHHESVTLLKTLSDADLNAKCQTPTGTSITVWKWLRAMLEHEVHRRGQLYLMLGLIGVETPPLFGLTSEEVLERSR